MKIFQFKAVLYKTSTDPKSLRIWFDKISGFTISLGGKIKHFILFDYGLLNKICDKIKYLLSKKVVFTNSIIIILEGSEVIHIILYLLKKY